MGEFAALGNGRAMRMLAVLAIVSLSASAPALAQSGEQRDEQRLQELERKLERSLQTIEELSERIRQLERGAARPEARTAPAPDEHDHGGAPALRAGAPALETPTVLKGFFDVGWASRGGGGNKGFFLGALDFYLTPQLSQNIKSVMELVFEHGENGELVADLERMQIGYTVSDTATVWLGRFHSSLGYWNTAFHHGQQLQTSVLRPRMIDFEDHGGVLPVHTIGLWGSGAMRVPHGRITYDVYGGNAPSIAGGVLDPNNSGRPHTSYSAGFNLGYRFGGVGGLKVGVHGYRADVRDDAPVANVTRLGIFGAYAGLESPDWELIAEYYGFRNRDLSGPGGRFSSWAGFAQLGRRFDAWTPYLRTEKADLDQADHYFAALSGGRAYQRQAVGLRYDWTFNSALKLELNQTRLHSGPAQTFSQAVLQWASRF